MIEYVDNVDGIGPEILTGFFEGWKKPHTPETHLDILKRSADVVLAVDPETRGFVP